MTTVPTKQPTTRLYVALDKTTARPVALIEATSAAQARSHLSRRTFDVRYAEQIDVLTAVKLSIEPEKATAESGE